MKGHVVIVRLGLTIEKSLKNWDSPVKREKCGLCVYM
jgi:hypothetical protein